MRRIAAGILFVAALSAGGLARAHEVTIDGDSTIESLQTMLDDLDRMEELNDRNPNRHSRQRIQERIKSLRTEIRRLRHDVRTAPPVVIEDPVPPDAPVDPVEPEPPAPMDAKSFSALLKAIDDASFSRDKLGVLDEACKFHLFSTSQVIAVMDALSFSKDKVEAAAMMHARLVDPDQFFQVYSHFDFEGDKAKLRKRIGQ